MSRDQIPEQHAFDFRQTGQGQQVIQRRSIAPLGQGTYIATNVPYTNAPQGDREYDDEYPSRMPTSTRRYQPGIYGQPTQVYQHGNKTFVRHKGQVPPKQSYPPQQQQHPTMTARPAPKPKRGTTRKIHFHPLVWLGAGMIVMIFLWVGFSNALVWWQMHQDDATYGRPRTFQIDAVVGHNDSPQNPSHFIVVNLNRHVIVVEIPGGDTSKSRIYNITTLFGGGQELTPVTLSFTDTQGNGKPDMIIHIQDQRIPFYNDGTQFRPTK